MARLHTKCTECSDTLYFDLEDVPPQAVTCICQATTLTETGPTGSFEDLTDTEVQDLTHGIQRPDMLAMRTIMDGASVSRPRHCFRWNNTESRWELSEVAPIDRTLLATRDGLTWNTV